MKKFLTRAAIVVAVVGVAVVVRQAILDMRESDELWEAITEYVDAQEEA